MWSSESLKANAFAIILLNLLSKSGLDQGNVEACGENR